MRGSAHNLAAKIVNRWHISELFTQLTDLQITINFPNLVGVLGSVRLSSFARLTAWSKTEDIWDNVSRSGRCASSFHPQGYLYVGLALGVRVIFWIFSKSLQNRLS